MFVYVYLQVQCSSGNNRNISHMRNYLLLGLFKDSFSLETNGLGHLLPLVAKYKKWMSPFDGSDRSNGVKLLCESEMTVCDVTDLKIPDNSSLSRRG